MQAIWVFGASVSSGFTNVVIIVPQTSVDEVVYENSLKKNGGRWMLHPEKKSIASIAVFEWKFSRPRDLVMVFSLSPFLQQKGSYGRTGLRYFWYLKRVNGCVEHQGPGLCKFKLVSCYITSLIWKLSGIDRGCADVSFFVSFLYEKPRVEAADRQLGYHR